MTIIWELQLETRNDAEFYCESTICNSRAAQTEIIVVDWGSSQPLHDAIVLNDAAKHIVRFIEVPISVHEKVNQGSSFPVAIALNAGIRRAAGDFIALTSGDVLWTSNTLKSFILPVTTGIKDNDALDQTLIFIPRKNIPWKFVNQSPGMEEMTNSYY